MKRTGLDDLVSRRWERLVRMQGQLGAVGDGDLREEPRDRSGRIDRVLRERWDVSEEEEVAEVHARLALGALSAVLAPPARDAYHPGRDALQAPRTGIVTEDSMDRATHDPNGRHALARLLAAGGDA